MATMINYANDWSYDLFVEDAKLYKAKPIKGVHCRSNASDREKFMIYLKDMVRDFKVEWLKEHKGLYDNFDGWIGDRFKDCLYNSYFSDYYKEVYNQRPHLPMCYYITVLGLPTGDDIFRTFCATPVEDAVKRAKEVRNNFENFKF